MPEGDAAAFIVLNHISGPEYDTPPPKVSINAWSLWRCAGPDLKVVLKHKSDAIVCPELGTRYPAAA